MPSEQKSFERAIGAVGLDEAVARYGQPAVRCYEYQVSQDTFLYWQMTLRKRSAEVVSLLRRRNGRYVIHTKAFYPQGVYRLLSGGIKPGEDLAAAVEREVREETSLKVRIERFLAILHHRFVWQGQSLPFTSYLFLAAEEGGTLGSSDPGEEISGYREVALEELHGVADELRALPPDWIDWGRFRASAHDLAVEVMATHGRS